MDKKERFERYKYLSGLSSWEISSYKEPEYKIFVHDGPSGLRRPIDQGVNVITEIIKSVSIPTPSALAASFDNSASYAAGVVLSKECKYHGTHILLAPGINIKRNALCGRNFEYFSEDPYLAGRLAAEYINGLEDNGVGTCVKHYAANHQEHARCIMSAEVSKRALNEIYLRVFKYTLKFSNPSSLMTSYNRINSEYVNESSYLLNTKLRGEFNYKGLIMSDWDAVSNKWSSIKHLLDVEMPKSPMENEYIDRGYNTIFTDEDLITIDNHVHECISKFKGYKQVDSIDLDELHNEVVDIANKTIVLAKNASNYLPFKTNEKILVLGHFAKKAYIVGGGSGWVNSHKPLTLIEVLEQKNIDFDFVELYDEKTLLVSDLTEYKDKYDKVLLCLGQYFESEGSDRYSLNLMPHQRQALNVVKNTFENFATVVTTGSVLNVSDVFNCSTSLILNYLAGEGQSEALYNNIFGLYNPSGRLPETWISSLEQNPIYEQFMSRNTYFVYYDDDIYVGYRYYDKNSNGFMLPFGYGLSYSKFTYSDFDVVKKADKIFAYVTVSNISDVDGEDVIQLYASKQESNIYRPIKELVGFKKVFVKANSSLKVMIEVENDALASYNQTTDSMQIENGVYTIMVALNANDILYQSDVFVDGVIFDTDLVPVKLERKKIENKYTPDSPGGLLLDNKYFIEYAKAHNYDLEYDDFANRYWIWDSIPIRTLVRNGRLKITYEEMDNLLEYLNSTPKNIDEQYNFDQFVTPHYKINKW